MTVMRQIQSMFRDYLWSGNGEKKHYPIAWEVVCRPRIKGGLDFKEILSWNRALLSNHLITLAQTASDRDSLWVRWVRSTKLQNCTLWDCERKDNDSTFWKDLLVLRDDLLCHNTAAQITQATPGWIYDRLQLDLNDVPWTDWIWAKVHSPKAAFISWMAIQGRLYTLDRIAKFAGHIDTCCCLCNMAPENHQHLFFQCPISQQILKRVLEVVEYPMVTNQLEEWSRKFEMARKPQSTMFQLRASAISCTIYCVWTGRNEVRFQGVTCEVDRMYFRAYNMLKLMWHDKLRQNRFTRSIGERLNVRW